MTITMMIITTVSTTTTTMTITMATTMRVSTMTMMMTTITAMDTAMVNTIPTSGLIRFAPLSRSRTSETGLSKLTQAAPMDTGRTRPSTPPSSRS